MHPNQRNSVNPVVRKEADQRREKTTEALNTFNETAFSLVPGGDIAYNLLIDREISADGYVWAAVGIIPLAKAGKFVGRGIAILSKGEILRIQNAATKIGKPIYIVGSRASGTATGYSDWDYIIEGLTNKEWKKIKNSLPGAKSAIDNVSRNIDIIRESLDVTRPYIIYKN